MYHKEAGVWLVKVEREPLQSSGFPKAAAVNVAPQ